jgi:hypothetical protein
MLDFSNICAIIKIEIERRKTLKKPERKNRMEYFEIMDTNFTEVREWDEFQADLAEALETGEWPADRWETKTGE